MIFFLAKSSGRSGCAQPERPLFIGSAGALGLATLRDADLCRFPEAVGRIRRGAHRGHAGLELRCGRGSRTVRIRVDHAGVERVAVRILTAGNEVVAAVALHAVFTSRGRACQRQRTIAASGAARCAAARSRATGAATDSARSRAARASSDSDPTTATASASARAASATTTSSVPTTGATGTATARVR